MLRQRILMLVLVLFAAASCSGGGGDSGGDGSELKRETRTAVRLIHGSLDASPVELYVGRQPETFSQKARYAEDKFYVSVDRGDSDLRIERANSVGKTVAAFDGPLEKDTEYTVFIYGNAKQGTFRVTLLSDQTERPAAGRAFVQILNAIEDRGDITASVLSGSIVGTAEYGKSSGFSNVASGSQTFELRDSDGDLVDTKTVVIPEQGELTLLVSGSKDLGVAVTTAFLDLD